jgi:hypothetical protein
MSRIKNHVYHSLPINTQSPQNDCQLSHDTDLLESTSVIDT